MTVLEHHHNTRRPAVPVLFVCVLLTALWLIPAMSTAGDERTPADQPAAEDGEADRDQAEKSSRPAEEAEPRPAEPKQVAPAEEADDDEPIRFTNEDLPDVPRMYRRDPDDGDDDPQQSGRRGRNDAQDDDEKSEAAAPRSAADIEREAREKRRQALRGKIADLEERIAYLEERRLAVKNPFLRGGTPSEDDEEDAVGGQSNVARLSWVEEQVASAQEGIRKTREALSALDRR